MPLDHTTIQQVRSHSAAIDRCAFELVESFCQRFFTACPHLRRAFPTSLNLTERRAMAQQWAWFIRHLAEFDRVSARFGSICSRLATRGFGHDDFRMARMCLLEATREVSQTCNVAWGPMQESAWAEVVDACMNRVFTVTPVALAKAA